MWGGETLISSSYELTGGESTERAREGYGGYSRNGHTDAGMLDGRFVLNQPIAQAEDGEMVEMILDILFTGWESGGMLVFEIERGNIGSTQVEFYEVLEDEPVLLETLTWGGLGGDGRNALNYQVPVEELFDEIP